MRASWAFLIESNPWVPRTPAGYCSAMSTEPLYERVRESIAEAIDHGTFLPGERLPAEWQLAQMHGVNRLTVRRALEELARVGIVEARQGSGTFVLPPIDPVSVPLHLEFSALPITATVHQIAARGHECRELLGPAMLVTAGSASATPELPQGPQWRVDSTLVVDGTPWMWSRSWVPYSLIHEPESCWDPRVGLAGLLDDAAGAVQLVWLKFAAGAASKEETHSLGVALGTPILVHEGLAVDVSGTPVARFVCRARMDRMSYVVSRDHL